MWQARQGMAVVSGDVMHKRYLTLYNQRVRFPTVCLPAARLADRACYSLTRLCKLAVKKSQTMSVSYPDDTCCIQGVEHDFDIVGHPQSQFKFAVTFPFHPPTEQSPGVQSPCIASQTRLLWHPIQSDIVVVVSTGHTAAGILPGAQ